MGQILTTWARPDPTRARDIVLARPSDVGRELWIKREMDELGIRPVRGTSLQTWEETLQTAQVAGPALSGTAATSILPTHAVYTLPANFFSIGKQLRIQAWGQVSNIVTTPGTLTLDVRLGTTTVVFNGGTMALNVVAKTNVTWEFVANLVCRSIGSGTAATILGVGSWSSESVASATAGQRASLNLPASAPVVGTGFDSTAAQAVNVFGTFSLTGNGLTGMTYSLEALN